MGKTFRWFNKIDLYYNPYWHRHELKIVRSNLHRSYRHENRIVIQKGCGEITIEDKTRGWETW